MLKECKWEYLLEKWNKETNNTLLKNNTYKEIIWYQNEILYFLYKNIDKYSNVGFILYDIIKSQGISLPLTDISTNRDCIDFFKEYFNKEGRVYIIQYETEDECRRK